VDMILLDWTRMGKLYCLAGAVAEKGAVRIVRPLLLKHHDAPVRNVGWSAYLLDGHSRWEVFELLGPQTAQPEPPHLEDLWVRAIRSRGRLASPGQRREILAATVTEPDDAAFGAPLGNTRASLFLAPGTGQRSLTTLAVPAKQIQFTASQREGVDEPDYRVHLQVPALGDRWLPVKDHHLLCRAERAAADLPGRIKLLDQAVQQMGELVAVRLGLTRPFQSYGRARPRFLLAHGGRLLFPRRSSTLNRGGKTMDALLDHLLCRLTQVQEHLGIEPAASLSAASRFADVLDSMGMVEFLMLLAQDCGVTPPVIEECVGRNFRTVGELADAMAAAGMSRTTAQVVPGRISPRNVSPDSTPSPLQPPATAIWLTATASRLPERVQSGAAINAALDRPAGWFEGHAGIQQRRIWEDQDPLAAAVAAAYDCLNRSRLGMDEIGALLVTSEAPPLLAGLAAAIHHRLGLRPSTVALEVGGACTGFLAAVWTARGAGAECRGGPRDLR